VKAAPKFAGGYVNRGAILLERGDLDRALADLEAAIALDPRNAMAIANRGIVLGQKGEFARAIADFDTASRLAPNFVKPLANLGFAHFAQGDFQAAAADFAKLGETEPKHAYAALWRYIAQARDGNIAKSALENSTNPAGGSAWPAPVIAFFLGKLTREELDRATSQGDEQTRRGQSCETAFYLGEQALLEKRADGARTLIRKAMDVCPSGFLERVGALGEWRRLQQ
jgi:lipoprotein NlpI